jgi:hypothetical protein
MLICPAVHIPTRSLLRSSSTPEPSDPLCSVVILKTIASLSRQKSRDSQFKEKKRFEQFSFTGVRATVFLGKPSEFPEEAKNALSFFTQHLSTL